MKTVRVTAALALSASICLADANVEQKTQVNIRGAIGAVVNVFSRSAREGATSTTIVKGNRKLTRTGNSGELIDLGEEKVYSIDYDRNAYTVKTFAQMRREFEEQQERAKKDAEKQEKQAKSDSKNEGPEYQVDFDIKSTGAKQTLNGFDTRQQIVTVSVHEKGKKLEQSGGWVLTSDMWMGPKVAAMNEIYDFDRRFMQKVYGSAMADMRQIALAMMATPAFGKAMKTFNDKKGTLDGTPILTKMSFETVAGSDPSTQQEAKQNESSAPTSVQGALVGGLMNRMKARREEKKAESGQPSNPNRSTMFDSTTEVTRATATATTADVAIPAGFKQR